MNNIELSCNVRGHLVDILANGDRVARYNTADDTLVVFKLLQDPKLKSHRQLLTTITELLRSRIY